MSDMKFNFSWEFKNFEIRSNYSSKNSPIEIIKYFDDSHIHCYVVAYWSRDDEGYELRFVGSRPFNDMSAEDIACIWPQLKAAQEMLDAFFEACEETETMEGHRQ